MRKAVAKMTRVSSSARKTREPDADMQIRDWAPPAYLGPNAALDHVFRVLPDTPERERAFCALIDADGGRDACWPRHSGLACVRDFEGLTPEALTTQVPGLDRATAAWLIAHLITIFDKKHSKANLQERT
jgi:hypothetical protein